MKNMNAMFMNTKSAFANTNAGFSCAQMPYATESEYGVLIMGAIAVVSIFILPIISIAGLLALRLWIAGKTK